MQKTTTILLQSKVFVKIYYLFIFDCNYFFEFKKILYLIVYIYLVNVFIKVVLIQNKLNNLVYISRNYRLDKLIKIDYSYMYFIENKKEEIWNLVAKQLKFKY